MPTLMTAPERMGLILPWLNGEFDEHVWGMNPLYRRPGYGAGEGPEDLDIKTDFAAIRRQLKDFIRSFDGSAGAAFVMTEPAAVAAVDALDEEVIGDLETRLNLMLRQGFGEPSLQGSSAPVSSLRFQICGMGRQKPRGSIAQGTIQARRRYREAGAYALRIHGELMDLVPLLLGQLLTAPGMVVVKRCQYEGCPHYIVETLAPGRPPQFCSGVCREGAKEMEQKRKMRTKR